MEGYVLTLKNRHKFYISEIERNTIVIEHRNDKESLYEINDCHFVLSSIESIERRVINNIDVPVNGLLGDIASCGDLAEAINETLKEID